MTKTLISPNCLLPVKWEANCQWHATEVFTSHNVVLTSSGCLPPSYPLLKITKIFFDNKEEIFVLFHQEVST